MNLFKRLVAYFTLFPIKYKNQIIQKAKENEYNQKARHKNTFTTPQY